MAACTCFYRQVLSFLRNEGGEAIWLDIGAVGREWCALRQVNETFTAQRCDALECSEVQSDCFDGLEEVRLEARRHAGVAIT